MSVLIKGIRIPDKPILIKILPNETAIICDDDPYETDCFEIEPHGDLIDREEIASSLSKWWKRLYEQYGAFDEYVACLTSVLDGLDTCKVIIPAERSEE